MNIEVELKERQGKKIGSKGNGSRALGEPKEKGAGRRESRENEN